VKIAWYRSRAIGTTKISSSPSFSCSTRWICCSTGGFGPALEDERERRAPAGLARDLRHLEQLDLERLRSVGRDPEAVPRALRSESSGCKGWHVFRDPNDSDRVWAIFGWDEAGRKGFTSDPEVPAIFHSGSRVYARSAQVGDFLRQHDA
jgi:hypothetical protein